MKRSDVLTLLAVLALAGVLPAQTPATLPETPQGKIVARYLEAFNSGNDASMRAFLTGNVAAEGLQRRPVEARMEVFKEMYGNTGGLELIRLLGAGGDSVAGVFHTKQGEWRRITFQFEPDPPYKLLGLRVEDAEPPTAATPPVPAAPPPRLAPGELAPAIERDADSLAAADAFSGVVLVARQGRPIVARAYGMADVAAGVRNNLDTKFNLGSDNKLFTQVAIGQLIDQGRLSFDDTLGRILPDYPNRTAAAKVTVRQLLTMRSGIGDFFGPEFDVAPHSIRTTADFMKLFADKPLQFEPGTSQQYSNGGYVVLGAIVEKLSGQSYYDYVREHIYRPAGMTDTDSYELDATVPNRATGYTREKVPGGAPRRDNIASLPGRGSSAGGGYSTAPDLLRFAVAVHAGKLLSPKLTTWLVTRQEPAEQGGAELPRSFGWIGGSPGVNASFLSNATTGYTVIVLSNYDPPSAEQLSRQIRVLIGAVVE
jgi:CubicO group peptidase (beta-lactamase class C family)